MKTFKFVSFLLFFFISLYIMGCKGDVGPTGPAGPSLTGNISGLVTLIDTNGIQPVNKSGVTITIEGTSYTATTDSTGKWQINNVSTGNYTIDISKNTYGMTKIQNYQFVGGGTTYTGNQFLSEVPNFTVSNLAYTTGSGRITVTGTLTYTSAQANGRNIIIFVGNSSGVSSTPALNLGTVAAYDSSQGTTFSVNITDETFSNLGLGQGSTAYLIAYASSAPPANCTRYVDQATGRFNYTSLSSAASNVLQVVTPDRPVLGNSQR